MGREWSQVDILKIDTEGHDAIVLQGAYPLFEKQLIRVVVFEYHDLPPWDTFRLEDVVGKLDVCGYECYFEGARRLWPISGGCWDDKYEFHHWSNVMCILRSDVWYEVVQEFDVSLRFESVCDAFYTAAGSEKEKHPHRQGNPQIPLSFRDRNKPPGGI